MNKDQWQNKGAGHRDRLRQRYLERGLDSLSDSEVLELLLSFGTPRKDTKEQARTLLNRFKSFSGVLDAQNRELLQIKGVGPKNSFALGFVKAVANRYLQQRLQQKSYLKSSGEVIEYLMHSMRGLQVEVFTVIYLDAALAVIESEIVAEGTVNVNSIYPREIIKRALAHNASALIVAHNHPSGSLRPSGHDRQLTRSLYLTCSLMQIRLLDHLIIGDGYFSFADNGIIAEAEAWSASVTRGAENPAAQ
jgi:DNA repair protein RadC